MRKYIKSTTLTVLLAAIVASSGLQASRVSIPNTFTSGTKAVAQDVNSNFTAVKSSVDDNDSRITSNTSSITSNTSSITSNTSSITSNASSITSNTSSITSNTGNIASQATRIGKFEAGSISVSMTGLQDDNTEEATCVYRKSAGRVYLKAGASNGCPDIQAPVSLPHGRTVTGLHCYAFDNDGGLNNVDSFELVRVLLSSGVQSEIFRTPGSVNNAAVQKLSDTTATTNTAVIDNASYAYLVQTGIDASTSAGEADIRVIGCEITYQ